MVDLLLSVPSVLAGTLVTGMYLEAKYNFSDDLRVLSKIKRARNAYSQAEKRNRISMWYALSETCKRQWNNRAIWSRERSLTFGDLYLEVTQYANWLLEQGVRPGDAVALYMKNCPEFIILWFATVCIGAFPALVNYNLEAETLLHCLEICETKLLLTSADRDCRDRIERWQKSIEGKSIRIINIEETIRQDIARMRLEVPCDSYRDSVTGDTPFCLVFTSGTTGTPKACPVPHRNFRSAGVHLEPSYGSIIGVSCWYNPMPLYHGTGGFTSTWTLLSGIGIALSPRFSVSRFWDDVHDSEATHFVYVGETARYLVNSPPHPLERKHKLVCAYGNGLRLDVWKKFQERFKIPEVVELFNSTEGMMGLVNRVRGPYRMGAVGHHGLIMRTYLHNTYIPVKIDQDTGDVWRDPRTGFAQRVAYEEGGEVLVAIPNKQAFSGYWNAPEATEKKFITNVFKKNDLYYRTGDALRRTPDGLWYFMDRLGDTFRWKAENVSTAEVSNVLGHFSGIEEANVYGVELPMHDGRAGCATIQLSPDFARNPDFRALLQHASAHLPRYAVPVFLRLTQTQSHIHNFKQNKVPLRKEGVDPQLIGTEMPEGADDKIFWLPPKGDTYVPFTQREWNNLVHGHARL